MGVAECIIGLAYVALVFILVLLMIAVTFFTISFLIYLFIKSF